MQILSRHAIWRHLFLSAVNLSFFHPRIASFFLWKGVWEPSIHHGMALYIFHTLLDFRYRKCGCDIGNVLGYFRVWTEWSRKYVEYMCSFETLYSFIVWGHKASTETLWNDMYVCMYVYSKNYSFIVTEMNEILF